jgi:hypothetical protein
LRVLWQSWISHNMNKMILSSWRLAAKSSSKQHVVVLLSLVMEKV